MSQPFLRVFIADDSNRKLPRARIIFCSVSPTSNERWRYWQEWKGSVCFSSPCLPPFLRQSLVMRFFLLTLSTHSSPLSSSSCQLSCYCHFHLTPFPLLAVCLDPILPLYNQLKKSKPVRAAYKATLITNPLDKAKVIWSVIKVYPFQQINGGALTCRGNSMPQTPEQHSKEDSQ